MEEYISKGTEAYQLGLYGNLVFKENDKQQNSYVFEMNKFVRFEPLEGKLHCSLGHHCLVLSYFVFFLHM